MTPPITLLQTPIHPLTSEALLSHAVAWAGQPGQRTILYANIHVANTAARDPELRHALARADLVYCDGLGIKLGAKLAGVGRLPERMTAADFIWDLARQAAEADISIYWLGGAPGVAEKALARLSEAAPGLRVAGAHHGYFAKQGTETDTVISGINHCHPEILLVGMGTPIQEHWVLRHRARIAAPVVWCVGATADFLAGVQPRAPRVLTENGLEWLHRLAVDPRRMFRRYVLGNPLFLARVLAHRISRALRLR